MKYDFETVSDRNKMGSRKWAMRSEQFPNMDKDVVPFSIADMEFKNAPEIIDGLKSKLEDIVLGYSMPTNDFYNAVINWEKEKHDSTIEKEWIVTVPGVVDGFFAAVNTFTNKNDGVIIMKPVYGPFSLAIKLNERKLVDVALKNQNNKYSINFEKFEEECKKVENKMVIFCNPHNPGGILWTKQDLEKVIRIAKENDVKVVVDEIWQDVVMPGNKHTSAMSLDSDLVNGIVVCKSATKSFNIAGLCCAYTIIPNSEMMTKYRKTLSIMRSEAVNIMGLEATRIAYTQCEKWLKEVVEVIDTNQKIVNNFFKEKYPKIIANKIQATYVMWIDFRTLGMHNDELISLLGKKASLVLTDGRAFGDCDGYMRFNVAAPTKVIKSALERLDELLKEIYK